MKTLKQMSFASVLFSLFVSQTGFAQPAQAPSKHISPPWATETETQQARLQPEDLFHYFDFSFYIGRGVDYQKVQDQTNQNISADSVLLGMQRKRLGFFYEANRIEEKTGTGNLNIERRNNSHMLWVDYDVIQFASSKKVFQMKGFLGGGLGMTLDTVTTKFMDMQDKDQSEYQWKGGAQIGATLQLYFVSLRVDGQMLTGANRTPNPGYAGFARLGMVF